MYTLTPKDKENIRKKQYLSKSDFKLADDCPVKLYYKKMNYPAAGLDNDYMQLLAECGYIVGKMAQLYYPEGIEIETGSDLVRGAEETIDHLKKDKVILFEPVLYHDHCLIRADILVKNGKKIDLIEVKSKGFKSEVTSTGGFFIDKSVFYNTKGIAPGWESYLLDIAFQTQVTKNIFPNSTITSFLMMPDKAKTTSIDSLPDMFSLKKTSDPRKNYNVITVDFKGNQKAIIDDNILTKVDVSDICHKLSDDVNDSLGEYLCIVSSGFKKYSVETSKACKSCEYVLPSPNNKSGFAECWGFEPALSIDDPKDHLFDLYHGGSIKVDGTALLDDLFSKGKDSIYDIPLDVLKGKRGERQKIQIEYTREKREWFSDAMKHVLKSFEYPLQFMDFETSRIAVPYHKGMNPYEQIAFQWSLHTIEKPGVEIVHKEWINIEEKYPNFKFAETLIESLNEKGTIFMWATHENTVMRDIYSQMEKYDYKNEAMRKWLERNIRFNRDEEGKFIDMNKLCLEHYFHPDMGGRTSLKYVLPAIWNNNPALHRNSWFKKYFKKENGRVINPYDTLAKIDIYEEAEVVKEGGGAMMAYQEMMYGLSKTDKTHRDAWKKLLLQYCELDTMAMIIVWKHWMERVLKP